MGKFFFPFNNNNRLILSNKQSIVCLFSDFEEERAKKVLMFFIFLAKIMLINCSKFIISTFFSSSMDGHYHYRRPLSKQTKFLNQKFWNFRKPGSHQNQSKKTLLSSNPFPSSSTQIYLWFEKWWYFFFWQNHKQWIFSTNKQTNQKMNAGLFSIHPSTEKNIHFFNMFSVLAIIIITLYLPSSSPPLHNDGSITKLSVFWILTNIQKMIPVMMMKTMDSKWWILSFVCEGTKWY